MGHKKLLEPYHVMNAAGTPVSVSGTTTYTSRAINVKNIDNIGLQLIWTGTPTGTWTVMHSPNNSAYDSITLSPVITQPAGSSGSWSVVLQLEPYEWVKVQYVNASSTGTVDVIVVGKDLN